MKEESKLNKTIMKFTLLSACLDPLKLIYVALLGFVMPIGMKTASLLHGVSDSQSFEMLTGKVGVAFVLMVLCLGLAGNNNTSSGRGGEYLPLIFSRPVSKAEYVISKWIVIAFIGGIVGALQNIVIALIGIKFGEVLTLNALLCIICERFCDAALISAAMILTMLYKHPAFQIIAILAFYTWLSGQTIPPVTVADAGGGGAVALSIASTKFLINMSQHVGNLVLPTLNIYDLVNARQFNLVPFLSYFTALSTYLLLGVTATSRREFFYGSK